MFKQDFFDGLAAGFHDFCRFGLGSSSPYFLLLLCGYSKQIKLTFLVLLIFFFMGLTSFEFFKACIIANDLDLWYVQFFAMTR